MELLQLKEKILELFETDINHLGDALMNTLKNNDCSKMDRFVSLVDGDLSEDWLQKIFQYYHADRKEKKQDYTPKSLAEFMSRLIGEADILVDMCAGSGALTIQRWRQFPEQKVRCVELDENVIPYLLFNLAIRNIDASVWRTDVLSEKTYEKYRIVKGEKYGSLACVKSAL